VSESQQAYAVSMSEGLFQAPATACAAARSIPGLLLVAFGADSKTSALKEVQHLCIVLDPFTRMKVNGQHFLYSGCTKAACHVPPRSCFERCGTQSCEAAGRYDGLERTESDCQVVLAQFYHQCSCKFSYRLQIPTTFLTCTVNSSCALSL